MPEPVRHLYVPDEPESTERKIRWNLGRAETFIENALDCIVRCGALSKDWREEFGTDVNEMKIRLDQIQAML